jgi:YVTN family beta-propeller protein
MRHRLLLDSVVLAIMLATSASFLVAGDAPARRADENVNSPDVRARQGLVPGDALLFNGWGVTPAGRHVPIRSDLPLRMLVAPDHKTLVTLTGGYNDQGLTLIDLDREKVTAHLPMTEAFNGLAFSADGKRIFATTGDRGEIAVFDYADGKATAAKSIKPDPKTPAAFLAGLTVDPRNGKVFVCNEQGHEIWLLNGQTLALEAKIHVGQYPHSCLLGADPRYLYVSDWGSSSVSIVDTTTNRLVRDLAVGLRPNEMVLAPDGRLFVACSGDNTVHVILTKSLEKAAVAADSTRRLWEGTREVLSTSLYPQSPEGSTPDALAVSPDGSTLFVANADNNDVMVVDISGKRLDDKARDNNESISIVEGFIPVGWYPSALAVSPDGKTLYVGNGKGLTSHPSVPAKYSIKPSDGAKFPVDHPGKTLEGSVSFITLPDGAQMAQYTRQVRSNSPYTPESFRKAPMASNGAIPDAIGRPSPIKYVLYIIKENRTYDQVLGDMIDANGKSLGNGDPKLTLYGEDVTPNQHRFARDYVLLDNLYCNGEVSVDGHSWCDAAIATDFNQREWIMSYSKHGKVPGNDEMENPAAGYLWDLCRRNGVTYRNYGEGAQRVPVTNRGVWKGKRDTEKAKHWIDDVQAAQAKGEPLPQFTIMALGEDHTSGTTPGSHTPDACVGNNDLALGQIVEAASKSKYWNEMAIFVIEDDAQNGPDHVDAHRTTGFVVSPYCRRGAVDSTLYTTASMVRTMELILGLPPMTQYDAGATPMFNSFQKTPQADQYAVLQPKVNLDAINGKKAPFAKESAAMDFSEYDLAPEDQLNRILWHVAKGMDTPYPTPIHRAVLWAPVAKTN